MVSVSASEPGGREFYPGLCSCSVFAIICNEFDTANLLQVRFMVTSELSLTCCKLTASLHSCHDKFVANLHSCHDKFVASLLQTKIAIWGVTSVQHKSMKIIFLKGKREVHKLSSAERGRLVTIVTYMLASGNFVPPMIVFPRKGMKNQLMDLVGFNQISLPIG
ncbi:hypothetical protein AVEN_85000-1 [Araneus ventricosus]|uniref:Uncharacterized protein n=1 Tax=Araneus ventricosus TaxID=182803 RepID=A0A4Y2C1T2_ARAVE|nr:hypothetical protein AVEN_85000-1 [Araneus ventricosus]